MTDKPTEWDDKGDLDHEEFGLWDDRCQACDRYGRVDDMSLCEECSGKIERDFIGKREWAYSAMAFGCPENELETLRDEIIKRYGERLELLADEDPPGRRDRGEREKRQ